MKNYVLKPWRQRARLTLELGCGLGLLLALVLTMLGVGQRRVAARVRADTLRLHILANSDTLEDQLIKLKVRDAILDALPPTVTGAQTSAEAAQALQQALPSLRAAANRALLRTHSGQAAQLRLEQTAFAARDYGSFTLPGGRYTALRVELGDAAGHNWFCVLYPALCVAGATADYPTAAENAFVFGKFEVRSALLDALCGYQSFE